MECRRSLFRVGVASAGLGVKRTAALEEEEEEEAAAAVVVAVSLLSIADGEKGGVKSVWPASLTLGAMRTVLECGIGWNNN